MRFRRCCSALLAAALLGTGALGVPGFAAAQTASSQEIALARQTAAEALGAYRAGDFEKALTLFQQAKAVYPSAQILRMEGYTLLALETWTKAAESMEAALASEIGPLAPEDRSDVSEQLAKALAHLGTVSVSSKVLGAELRVDGGAPLPLPLSKPVRLLEGAHRLVVRAPGHDDAADEIAIEGGKSIERVLDPVPKKKKPPPRPPLPPPQPKKTSWFPKQREVGFAAGGAGVALGGAALITALVGARIRGNVESDVALHEKNFGESCERGDYRLCVFDRAVINNDADRADGLRDASVWMGIGAGVLVAGGVVLVLFAGDGEGGAAKVGLAAEGGLLPAFDDSPAGERARVTSSRKRSTGGRFVCGLAAAPRLACAGTF